MIQAFGEQWVWIALLLGLLLGSFINVVAYRLPLMLERQWREDAAQAMGQELPAEPPFDQRFNLITPRSRCPHCGHPVRAWHNVPVLSYLFLRGRCADCGGKIRLRYPVVEAASGLLSAWVAYRLGATPQAAAGLVFLWYLIAITLIDADTTLLPDILTLPLLWLGLLLNVKGVFAPLSEAVIGAAAGYLVLWSVYWLFRLITGREGMGYGDFKLLAAIGAWFGWHMILPAILISSLSGAIIGITLIALRRHDRQIPIPFGPYLACAAFTCLLFGSAIQQALGWA